MFRRRQVKTHGRLMREEFGQSFDHLRLAAAHAAGGTADVIRPRFTAARRSVRPGLRKAKGASIAAFVPLVLTARGGVRQAGKVVGKGKARVTKKETPMARKRWPMMVSGLLVAGAAAGAAGAVVARRRASRSRWEEYGSTEPTVAIKPDSASALDSAKSNVDSGTDKVQSLAESAKDRAADLMGNTGQAGESSTTFGERASSVSKNSRS